MYFWPIKDLHDGETPDKRTFSETFPFYSHVNRPLTSKRHLWWETALPLWSLFQQPFLLFYHVNIYLCQAPPIFSDLFCLVLAVVLDEGFCCNRFLTPKSTVLVITEQRTKSHHGSLSDQGEIRPCLSYNSSSPPPELHRFQGEKNLLCSFKLA